MAKYRNTKLHPVPLILLFLLAFILVIFGFALFKLNEFYSSHTKRGISENDLQTLDIPYTVCLPTYLPAKLNSTPYITYSADFGDPIDSIVLLDYNLSSGDPLAIKLFYIYAPNINKFDTNRSPDSRSTAHYWLSYWAMELHGIGVEDQPLMIADTAYTDAENTYWQFEVIEPLVLHAVLIEWIDNEIYYQLYSILSVEESQKIANSIPRECE